MVRSSPPVDRLKGPWSLSCRCPEPRRFIGDRTLLARDNINIQTMASLSMQYILLSISTVTYPSTPSCDFMVPFAQVKKIKVVLPVKLPSFKIKLLRPWKNNQGTQEYRQSKKVIHISLSTLDSILMNICVIIKFIPLSYHMCKQKCAKWKNGNGNMTYWMFFDYSLGAVHYHRVIICYSCRGHFKIGASNTCFSSWEFCVPVMENFIPAGMVWHAIAIKHY